MIKEGIINQIIDIEWIMFGTTRNEGGRAYCQDDWETFSIMRKSQYMDWPEELLTSYLNDLQEAQRQGRNLISEKYGRMMQSTAPVEYDRISSAIPALDEERTKITEEIIRIQINWMEQFAEQYSNLANRARSIHTSSDSAYNTSYETYLRGELGTYSNETFVLYGRFIITLLQRGDNLACKTMENTVHLYGYETLSAANSIISI